jgi:hypothetical protein
MVDIWLFHPKKFLNFYTFCSKEFFFGCFMAACSLKKTLELAMISFFLKDHGLLIPQGLNIHGAAKLDMGNIT